MLSRLSGPRPAREVQGSELNRALEIDPRYAPAWNSLAGNAIARTDLGVWTSAESLARTRAATAKALEADPEYAPAYAMLSIIALYENDAAAATPHLERALALDPTDLSTLATSAMLLLELGRVEESRAIREFLCRRDYRSKRDSPY